MFAVIKTGGKQYKVAKNDVLKIEKVEGEAGSVIIFDEVLAYTDNKGNTKLGTPLVDGVKVSAEVIEQKKDDKVLIFKKKRRHNYRRKIGHRQQVVWIRIQDIAEGLKAKKAPAKKAEQKSEEKVVKKTAAKKTEEKKTEPKTEVKKAESKAEAKKAPAKKVEPKTEAKTENKGS